MSADHSARQNSTAMPAVTTTPGDPVAPRQPTGSYAGLRDGRAAALPRRVRPSTARTPTTGSTSSSAGRQPRPAATDRPTTSGAPAPTDAATALASVIAAGPVSSCSADSTVEVQVTTNEPPNEQSKAPNKVSGTAVNAVRTTMPVQISTSPAQIIAVRPNRVASGATHSALSRAPTASAVPCSPATVRLKPSSSRSTVRAGPKP